MRPLLAQADVLKAGPDVRFWTYRGHRKPFALIAY